MSTPPPQTTDEALASLLASDPLISTCYSYIKTYMSHYDASHDLSHIQRVLKLSAQIYSVESSSPGSPPLDLRTILLCALLHDVGDRKYLSPGEDASTLISSYLLSQSCPQELAERVQTICSGVSYSTEVKDPEKTRRLVEKYPELGVVQDADRLDAIGAVGVGRMFTYGGARTERSLTATMEHLDEKLVRLEGMMKTAEGRRLARERTERLKVFRRWWVEETGWTGREDEEEKA
ncbi:HD domain-containing protein [Coniochaeta sp. 2T2.1]|nr:HD domain-containing protein [Coniochaeta sp. 2T2.1]